MHQCLRAYRSTFADMLRLRGHHVQEPDPSRRTGRIHLSQQVYWSTQSIYEGHSIAYKMQTIEVVPYMLEVAGADGLIHAIVLVA